LVARLFRYVKKSLDEKMDAERPNIEAKPLDECLLSAEFVNVNFHFEEYSEEAGVRWSVTKPSTSDFLENIPI
jgi:hypothetical protein